MERALRTLRSLSDGTRGVPHVLQRPVSKALCGISTRNQAICIRLETEATAATCVTTISDPSCVTAARMIISALKAKRFLASTNGSGKDGSLPRICKPPLPFMANSTSLLFSLGIVKGLTTRSKTMGIFRTCAIHWRTAYITGRAIAQLGRMNPVTHKSVCHSLHLTRVVRH